MRTRVQVPTSLVKVDDGDTFSIEWKPGDVENVRILCRNSGSTPAPTSSTWVVATVYAAHTGETCRAAIHCRMHSPKACTGLSGSRARRRANACMKRPASWS
jgi:hypothetical protein